DSTVEAEALGGGLSMTVSIGLISAVAKNTAQVRSYLGRATTITAGAHAVSFTATSRSRVEGKAIGVSGSLGYGGAGVFVEATLGHTVRAFTTGGGSISAGAISFTADVNQHLGSGDDCDAYGACAKATAGAAALGASIADTDAHATDAPTVRV